jgi:hypothetical protein
MKTNLRIGLQTRIYKATQPLETNASPTSKTPTEKGRTTIRDGAKVGMMLGTITGTKINEYLRPEPI